ncbi:hypothetical protein ED733_005162 [Metarhizium rileyi]|uniref:Heat shock factor binding 1 n=1 Tax=Metarhizium rileyi (strain RCEF 4871) TaxID=1649241 RepID=A0A5C6G8H9_METRR|nr:hypothetical protein ED733_005162 [Metarhizium rileyi]
MSSKDPDSIVDKASVRSPSFLLLNNIPLFPFPPRNFQIPITNRAIRLTNRQSIDNANADVSAAVEELLNTLSNRFASVSSEIFAKMDEMSRRLDNLEAALQETKANEGSGSTKS